MNARSICNKQHELNELIICKRPDFLSITETWLRDDVKLTAFNNDIGGSDYTVFRQDRSNGGGGGVLLGVINSLKCKLVSKYCLEKCEAVFVDTEMKKNVFLRVGVVYRPPGTSYENSSLLFNFVRSQLVNVRHFCIYGDFNLPDINWEYSTGHSMISAEFLGLCFTVGASQCVDFPTRGANILDLVLCSDSNLIQDISCGVPFSTSDHACISYEMQPFLKETRHRVMRRCFGAADYVLINAFLTTVNWDAVFQNCNSACDFFQSL